MNSVTRPRAQTPIAARRVAPPPPPVEEDEYELWMRIWADIVQGSDPSLLRVFSRYYLPSIDEEELGGGD
ncbi:MAG TPA: hypothetical protein VL137_12145 [Polyangiaceae bacterium]|nr:hypothetical protein [Polyangiaceae bacterium]